MKMQRITAFVLAVLLVCLAVTPVWAAPGSGIAGEVTHEPSPTPAVTQTPTTPMTVPDKDWHHLWNLDDPEAQISPPTVTTDDIQNWVDRKGNDTINILQKVVKIISVAGFILCILLIIIGAVGNRRTMTAGIIGAIVAAVCYVAITQIDVILAFFSSWMTS